MTTQFKNKPVTQTIIMIVIALCCGATLTPVYAQNPVAMRQKSEYVVSTLPDFGGTSSGGNSINDQSWAAGYSRFPNRNRLHSGEAVCSPTSAHSEDQTAA